MRFLPVLLLVMGCTPTMVASDTASATGSCAGVWASGARPLYLGDDLVPTSVPAPNQALFVKATPDAMLIASKDGQASNLDVLVNPSLMEVLWSPDSQRLAFNVSDGGVVGSWEVTAYSVENRSKPAVISFAEEIKLLANALPQCEEKEDANIGIAAWLAGGKELLLVAEVPPHSSCRNMGALQGFRVSAATGKIIEQITEQSLRQKWNAVLGCRFSKNPE